MVNKEKKEKCFALIRDGMLVVSLTITKTDDNGICGCLAGGLIFEIDYYCSFFFFFLMNGSWSLPRSGEKFRNHEEAVGQSAEMGGAQSGRNKDYWTAGVEKY